MKDKTTPTQFMGTWLLQMNYPKVDVRLSRNAAQSSSRISFSQSRFLLGKLQDGPNPTYVSPYK